MGFLSYLGRFLGNCIFFVGNVISSAALTVDRYLDSLRSSEAVQMRAPERRLKLQKLQQQRNAIMDALEQLNNEYAQRMKRLADRSDEKRWLEDLYHQREALKSDLWELRDKEIRQKILMNPDRLDGTLISNDTIHLAQYHIGQAAAGKTCRMCGKSMLLQFPRNKNIISADEIFWACIGYYDGSCMHAERYSFEEQKLFSPEPVEEFHISKNELATIYNNANIQRGVEKRMKSHVRYSSDDYICPVHGVRLVLREKKDFKGALDQFFLGCPHWRGEEPGSCQYIVKIKSPAQLVAVLKSYEGRGIL